MRLLTLLLLLILGVPTLAAQSTVLEPVSPVDLRASYSTSSLAVPEVWADDAGHVVAAFPAKPVSASNTSPSTPYVACKSGSSWEVTELELPDVHSIGSTARLQLVGKWGDLYCFVKWGKKEYYYYTSTNGTSWSGPKVAATLYSSSDPGTARAGYVQDTPFFCCNQQGGANTKGQWFFWKQGSSFQGVRIAQRFVGSNYTLIDSAVDDRGRIYYVFVDGSSRATILSAPSLEAAKQTTSWKVLPSDINAMARDIWSTPHQGLALDPASQCLWLLSGSHAGEMQLTRLPFGATTKGASTSYTLGLPEGGTGFDYHGFVTNDRGAIGLLRSWSIRQDDVLRPHLTLYPISGSGVGTPLNLVRGGSDTESVTFRSSFGGVCGGVTPNGMAWMGAISEKLGEEPAGRRRLFLSKVTGWATNKQSPVTTAFGFGDAQQPDDARPPDTGPSGDTTPPDPVEPGVSGGDEGTPEVGTKPDFEISIRLGSARDVETEELQFNSLVRNVYVRVTNKGAQYFGDLPLKVFIGGTTAKFTFPDPSGHTMPLLKTGQSLSVNLLDIRFTPDGTAMEEPPAVIDCNTPGTHIVRVRTALGKYQISAFVDPGNEVPEANEDNNKDFLTFVLYDGREDTDRIPRTGESGYHYGANDVAIYDARILPNCSFSRFGLRQKPTTLALVVTNPRAARWMKQVEVVAKLDGQVLDTKTLPLVPDQPALSIAELPWSDLSGPPGEKTIRGEPVLFPLDLTTVALGQHTLEILVDPEGKLVDLAPDNNKVTLRFNVRPPGGTLTVKCQDSGNKQAISGATVRLENLWYMKTDSTGTATVEDFPPANYNDQTMSAEKLEPTRPYARKYAEPFSVKSQQTTNVTLELDGPVDIVGSITGPDGQKPVWGASVGFTGEYAKASYNRETGQYKITFAEPGANSIKVQAYGYLDKTVQGTYIADADGQAQQDIQLQEAPKGNVQGQVISYTGSPMAGVVVSLGGCPLWAETDSQGHYQINGAMAGRPYGVWAYKTSHVPATDYDIASLQANTTVTVDIVLHRVTQQTKSIGADVLTWAICESYPGFSLGSASSDGYEVSAYFGKFKPSLALTYHTEQGSNLVTVDNFVLGLVGDSFWESNVSSNWNPLDLVSSAVETASDAALGFVFGEKAGKVVAQLAKLAGPLNSIFNLATGDVDPSQLNDDNEIIGTYTTHTGTKREDSTLIELPSTEVPIGMSFKGGQTIVRCDRIEVTDGDKTKTFNRQWYSDSECLYAVNETFNLENLEVRCYLRVLNQNLSPGPLYANSKNWLVWKPGKTRSLKFEANNYPFIP